MLQRIQTVFLAIVVILSVLSSFLPIVEFTGYETTAVMDTYKTVSVGETSELIAKNMGVGVLHGLVLLLAIGIIFLFKNRQLQIKLAKLNILLIALQIAAIVMYSDSVKAAIGPNVEDVVVGFKFGAVIPVLCLIFTYLAIRFIKKDESLVRAADRLR
jgi:glucan phosphoethanolaminetransferase (alkaline phosphatase superfamily)